MAYPLITWCSILEELRSCFRTRNFSSMLALIEDLQCAGDRMEASLSGKRDIREWEKDRERLDKEIKQLRARKNDLENEIKDLTIGIEFLKKLVESKIDLSTISFSSFKNLKNLERSFKFHKIRVEALEELNKNHDIPEPFKTYICDILANGQIGNRDKYKGIGEIPGHPRYIVNDDE